MKRYISIFLVLMMLISSIPVGVFAESKNEIYDNMEPSYFPTGHQESLDSLTRQLATEGISLDLLVEDISSVQGPSEWEHRTRVSYEIVSKGKIAEVN